jgi:hypothetical protein
MLLFSVFTEETEKEIGFRESKKLFIPILYSLSPSSTPFVAVGGKIDDDKYT